jgi:chemotaxis protein CheD
MFPRTNNVSFRLITVGIADIQIAKSPDILRTILGSCVGVCFYDIKNRLGGLSHIMLPRISEYSKENNNIKKYADTAIPLLLDEMLKSGAEKNSIIAKIIGGAAMFKIASNSQLSSIGNSNIESVKNILSQLQIKIKAEELGGDNGRTIDFYMDTGLVKIKSLNKEIKII